jgi:predicted TPR repeat methyltransferase
MEIPIVDTLHHYEYLIDEGHDPFDDPEPLRRYMAQWDGRLFCNLLGDVTGKRILEIGIGTGRVAYEVLRGGCASLTGIDISPNTIHKAQQNLSSFPNVELIVADAEEYTRKGAFDTIYSVLTFMHIQNKLKGFPNVVNSLVAGGSFVLSIDQSQGWLDYGVRRVKLYSATADDYVAWLRAVGFEVEGAIELTDQWLDAAGKKSATFGQPIGVLIKAIKPS